MNDMDNQLKQELKTKLDPEDYRVIVEKGTERPFTGKYNDHDDEGVYLCKACGEKLFESGAKFNAGCGWPSFDKALGEKVGENVDDSLAMSRTEIVCAKCDAHLGHVFPDGPTSTGLRYCVNSASLDFKSA